MKKSSMILITLIITLNFSSVTYAQGVDKIDYNEALKDSILFFDGNRCGPNVEEDTVFPWRKNCHCQDVSVKGDNLTGGFHDAGDYLKMGLTQAYCPSVMGFAMNEYKSTFDATKNTQKCLDTLKIFTDYLLKCHPRKQIFYYLVGKDYDHELWRVPEDDTYSRQPDKKYVFYADSKHAASDICGETAAALAEMSVNEKNLDKAYSKKCLTAAKEIYKLGKSKLGVGRSNEDGTFYPSSGYYDHLAWGALWLYIATNNKSYKNECIKYISKNKKDIEGALEWDNVSVLVYLKLYQITKNNSYLSKVKENLDYYKKDVKITPGGLRYYDSKEGPLLSFNANEAFVTYTYSKITGDTSYNSISKSQLEYIFGNNPCNISYMVGFLGCGGNWPQIIHHNPSNGYANWEDGNGNSNLLKPNKYVLTGALIGGPEIDDVYIDGQGKGEPAIDYNAGFVACLASYLYNVGLH